MAFYWGEKTIDYRNATEGLDFVPAAQRVGFRDGDIPLLADGDTIRATDRDHVIKMIEADTVTVIRGGHDYVKIAIPDDFMFRLNDDKGFFAYHVPVVVKEIVDGQPAAEAGLNPDDQVVAVGGVDARSYAEFSKSWSRMAGSRRQSP